MTDVYDLSDDSRWILNQRRSTIGSAVLDLKANPDQAARAIQLGNSLNVPPAVVNGDIENYEAQHKAAITRRILEGDSDLREWAASDPMAAKIANDDWGQLSAVSDRLKQEKLEWHVPKIAAEGAKGFYRGFTEAAGQSIPALQEEYEKVPPWIRGNLIYRLPVLAAGGIRTGFELLSAGLVGGAHGIHDAAAQLGRETGMSEERALRFGRGMAELAEWKIMDVARQGVFVHDAEIYANRIKLAIDRAEPYISAGKPIPEGIDPLIDHARAIQAKYDTQTLDQIMDEADKSLARGRAKDIGADTFEKLIRRYVGDAEVAIPLEAVNRLYKGKTPEAGDGILGFDPDIAEKHRAASVDESDIRLKKAAYIAHIEPEARREIEKDVKPNPDGMNLNRAEEQAKVPIELEPVGKATPIVRYRRQAAEVERNLPPIAKDMTRLWRGNRPGEVGANPAFTSSLEGIALPFREAYGGPLSYVDVPTADLVKMRTGAGATEAEFMLPQELAARATPIEVGPSLADGVREGAALNQLTPVLLEEGQPEAPLFGKMAIGLPKKDYDRWTKLIDKQSEDEKAWELKKAYDIIKKKRSAEWKTAEAAMRPEVAMDVSNRPEWLAHDWLTHGVLRGTTGERPKINPDKLTPEQRLGIPEQFFRKNGSDPDDLATTIGFNTGDEMMAVMQRFYQQKGDMPAGDFLERTVRDALDKRMAEEHGKTADAILLEAQDHVTGIPQLERLHEQTVALGVKAGATITFTKESMQRAGREEVGRRSSSQTPDWYLKQSGDAGRKMIQAFLKQDWNEAFRQSQRQYMANIMAKEAGKVVKEIGQFEKLAKRMNKLEVKGFDNIFSGPYVPYIQEVLRLMDRHTARTPLDLIDAMSRTGTLDNFIADRRAMLREVNVLDLTKLKPVEEMSVNEFRDANNFLKSMVKSGRDEGLIYKEGQAHAVEEIVEKGMVDLIKSLGYVTKVSGKVKKAANTYYASSMTAESILNRIDRDDPGGLHNQYVVRPITEASNYESKLIRVYHKALVKAAGDIPNISKKVENSLWMNPETGMPFEMTMRDVLGMLMYWGSPTSRYKLLKGYNVDEATAYKWLLERTTKEDWDRSQRIGDIFERLFQMADRMQYELSGTPIKRIEINPIDTPHGRYRGWYNPVEYDSMFPGRKGGMVEKLLEGEGFYRANTPQDYTMPRTGYVAPIERNMDIVPQRIKQMIHDIAYRPAILQVSKVFYNNKWRAAMKNFYGPEWEAQFIPYLRDIANYSNSTGGYGDWVVEYFRQNLVNTMIGFNPHTVAKHGMTAAINSMTEVGPMAFLKAVKSLWQVNEETGDRNYRFAMDTSEELQKRTRRFLDYAGKPELALQGMGWRKTIGTFGATPVAIFDLASAVPTWLAKYEQAMLEHGDHGMAVFEADRAVRRAHGSAAITNLPAIMRSNAMGRTFSSLYGFFNHMLQKQFEMAWKARDSWQGIKAGDLSVAKQHSGALIWGLFSYVIVPALVEEMVTPYVGSDKDSWGVRAGKAVALDMAASSVGMRDLMHSIINGTDPASGLINTGFKYATTWNRDIARGNPFSRRYAGKTVRDTITLVGGLTGLTNAQEGKMAEYMINYFNGLERPRGPWEWMHGLTVGHDPKRRY